jgi:hypothetical protein
MKSLAVVFCALWIFILVLSLQFQYAHEYLQRPILLFVALWGILFSLLFAGCWLIKKQALSWQRIFVLGLIFRVLMCFSNPIQEDDFYRYLFDGAALSEGVNPFKFSPEEVKRSRDKSRLKEARYRLQTKPRPFTDSSEELTKDLKKLSLLSQNFYITELYYGESWKSEDPINILDRVNNSVVPTVYPPVAQVFFALSAKINKGSLWTLRIIFILVECLTMYLIVKILIFMKKDPAWLFLYAWNPLVIKEFVNSPHLDVLMVAATAACLYAYLLKKPYLSASCLALAIATKLFVAPLALFFLLWQKQKTLKPAVLCCASVLSAFALFGSAGSRQFQGLKTMALTNWNRNSVLMNFIPSSKASDQQALAFEPYYIFEEDQSLYREISKRDKDIRKALFFACLLWLAFCLFRARLSTTPQQQMSDMALCLTGLFLLSPAANPWYAGILMLFLPFVRWKFFLCVLGGSLGLYYLSFYFDYHFPENSAKYFHRIILVEGTIIFFGFLCQGRISLNKFLEGDSHGST